ncbi:MAG: hypothetical protein GF320_22315 [Armatimonadia bacterium]|nr:hypothetical protein [Armatimonadia bacterium]
MPRVRPESFCILMMGALLIALGGALAQAPLPEDDPPASSQAAEDEAASDEAADSDQATEEEEEDTRYRASGVGEDRKRLLLIPDEVLERARDGATIAAGGPRVTGVQGNDRRYRKYEFVEPSSPFLIDTLRSYGGDSDYKYMYDVWATTPFQNDSEYGLILQDFNEATSFQGHIQRYRFYRDFGVRAAPSERLDTSALARVRLDDNGWLEVWHERRSLTNPPMTTNAQAFLRDEIGVNASWRFGGTFVTAHWSGARYTDRTAAITPGNQPRAADRTTMEYGLRAGSANHAEAQWHAGVNVYDALYTSLGNARHTAVTAGGGVTFDASDDFDVISSVSHRSITRTFIQNTYRPDVTTFRLAGRFYGWSDFRGKFGYERETGTRVGFRPDPVSPVQFSERQAQDRWWVGGRFLNDNRLKVDLLLEGRTLTGDVTNYLNRNPIAVPILFYPKQTVFDVEASYPDGRNLYKAGVRMTRYQNSPRNTTVDGFKLTGLWTRTWSDRWSTLVQADHTTFRRRQGGASTLDTELSSVISAVTWGYKKAAISASYGLYASSGGFLARQDLFRLGVNYRTSDDLTVFLNYDHREESQTGPWAYSGDTVNLGVSHDF